MSMPRYTHTHSRQRTHMDSVLYLWDPHLSYIHIYVYTYKHRHASTQKCLTVCMCTYIHTYTYACVYTCMYIYIYTYTNMCVGMQAHIFLRIIVCMYVYVYVARYLFIYTYMVNFCQTMRRYECTHVCVWVYTHIGECKHMSGHANKHTDLFDKCLTPMVFLTVGVNHLSNHWVCMLVRGCVSSMYVYIHTICTWK